MEAYITYGDKILAPYNFEYSLHPTLDLHTHLPKESKVLALDSLDVDHKRYMTILMIIQALKIAMGVKFEQLVHPKRKDKIIFRSNFPLPEIPKTSRPITKKDLMNIIADLCHFPMHEVINRRGTFFYHDSYLAQDDKYHPLIEWEHHPF
ncbi:hypothetical protein BS78_K101000 [Paspalum vaginatum]|uniref:Uncharacterized protein n=1 Tax=Paspalum vaginatum TaxID=158149 RepID=A0A9W8CFA9_9POAL|nr:hypothetical protein BS78_K101000 [Paspalum vaginatum]